MNRRNFVKKLAVVPLVGVALIATPSANGLAKCDLCQKETPDKLISYKQPRSDYKPSNKYCDWVNPNWWDDCLGPNLAKVCILCVNHRFCYPYYEKVIFPQNYESLHNKKHECCWADLEQELKDFRATQLK